MIAMARFPKVICPARISHPNTLLYQKKAQPIRAPLFMKLTYRSTPYQTSIATIDAPESNITGRYRGLDFQISQPLPATPTPHALKYRGIPYNTVAIDTESDFPSHTAIVMRWLRPLLLLAGAFLAASIAG